MHIQFDKQENHICFWLTEDGIQALLEKETGLENQLGQNKRLEIKDLLDSYILEYVALAIEDQLGLVRLQKFLPSWFLKLVAYDDFIFFPNNDSGIINQIMCYKMSCSPYTFKDLKKHFTFDLLTGKSFYLVVTNLTQ